MDGQYVYIIYNIIRQKVRQYNNLFVNTYVTYFISNIFTFHSCVISFCVLIPSYVSCVSCASFCVSC